MSTKTSPKTAGLYDIGNISHPGLVGALGECKNDEIIVVILGGDVEKHTIIACCFTSVRHLIEIFVEKQPTSDLRESCRTKWEKEWDLLGGDNPRAWPVRRVVFIDPLKHKLMFGEVTMPQKRAQA